jgi:hypothetical protein
MFNIDARKFIEMAYEQSIVSKRNRLSNASDRKMQSDGRF